MARRTGTKYSETINGTEGNDVVSLLAGNDIGYGLGGNDKMYGGDGNDSLVGGEGGDTLYGGNGRDKLNGGGAGDFLYGGAGADSFLYFSTTSDNSGNAQLVDNIFDFSRREGDKIDLSAIDANTHRAGNNAFTFIGGRAFSGHGGEAQSFKLELPGGPMSIVEIDVNGDKQADLVIGVHGSLELKASDFVL